MQTPRLQVSGLLFDFSQYVMHIRAGGSVFLTLKRNSRFIRQALYLGVEATTSMAKERRLHLGKGTSVQL